MTTVNSWPKTLPMQSARSWNSTTETHLLPMFCKKKNFCQRFTCKRYTYPGNVYLLAVSWSTTTMTGSKLIQRQSVGFICYGVSQWSSQKMRRTGTISYWHMYIMYLSYVTLLVDVCMNVLNWNKLLQNKKNKNRNKGCFYSLSSQVITFFTKTGGAYDDKINN